MQFGLFVISTLSSADPIRNIGAITLRHEEEFTVTHSRIVALRGPSWRKNQGPFVAHKLRVLFACADERQNAPPHRSDCCSSLSRCVKQHRIVEAKRLGLDESNDEARCAIIHLVVSQGNGSIGVTFI